MHPPSHLLASHRFGMPEMNWMSGFAIAMLPSSDRDSRPTALRHACIWGALSQIMAAVQGPTEQGPTEREGERGEEAEASAGEGGATAGQAPGARKQGAPQIGRERRAGHCESRLAAQRLKASPGRPPGGHYGILDDTVRIYSMAQG